MDKKGLNLNISWTSIFRAVFAISLILAIYYTIDIFIILALAIIISSALDAPLNYLERKKIPRILGIIFIFIALLSIIALLLYTIFPITVLQISELINHFDKIQSTLYKILGVSKLATLLKLNFNTLSSAIFSGGFSFTAIFPRIFNNIVLTVSLIVISFYLALYRDGVEKFLRYILPLNQEEYVISVFHRARVKIGKWLEAQIMLSLIIAFITFLGLQILGVNYSLVLGLLAGIFEIIPFIGPIVAGALAFFVALSQSISLGIYALIFFVLVQQLEGHILVPIIMRKATGIHPVIVVISILAGAKIYGFIGVILAIPAVVVIQELLEDYTERKYRQPALK